MMTNTMPLRLISCLVATPMAEPEVMAEPPVDTGPWARPQAGESLQTLILHRKEETTMNLNHQQCWNVTR